MNITALVENTTKLDCPVEHGLSLYIETEKHKILFDTGQGSLFSENATRFGIDLAKVDLCILSHGHYDHGGGLKEFTDINKEAPIYMNKNAFGLHYHGSERYIGLNRDWIEDEEFQRRVIYTDGGYKIDEELEIFAPGAKSKIDMGSAGLCVKDGGIFAPEDFRHEHYLMIEEGGKRVLISGCSHRGIINIMEWFKPDVLVGGFHFMKHELDDELVEYATALAKFDTMYYTCHCTGVDQYNFIKPHIERMSYLSEGMKISI